MSAKRPRPREAGAKPGVAASAYPALPDAPMLGCIMLTRPKRLFFRASDFQLPQINVQETPGTARKNMFAIGENCCAAMLTHLSAQGLKTDPNILPDLPGKIDVPENVVLTKECGTQRSVRQHGASMFSHAQ